MRENNYDDPDAVQHQVLAGNHRGAIGGMWDEIGRLQYDFLVANGLRAEHTLLDVGCGSLRGGVHFIAHLDPGNYWGMDLNSSLLDAGWDRELGPAGLQQRQPREQLVALDDFQFARLDARFDFAVAISVFTHMSLNRVRRCLSRLAPVMSPGGTFFATIFVPGPGLDFEEPAPQLDGIVTHSSRDPFHYRVSDMEHAAADGCWDVEFIGDWRHPRNQQMVAFTRDG